MKMLCCRVAAIGLLAVACSDADPTGPAGQQGSFATDRSAYEPYQVAVLTLDAPVPASGVAVSGTLGGEPITLVTRPDSSLLFLVPAQASGSLELAFSTGGRSYSGALTVTPVEAVANPLQYITAVSEQAVHAIAELESQLVEDEGDHATQSMLGAARDSIAAFGAALSHMTDAELAQLAGLLRANLSSSQGAGVLPGMVAGASPGEALAIPPQCRHHPTPFSSYMCMWGVFGTQIKDVAIYLGAAWLLAESAPITGVFGIGASAVFSAFALIEGAFALQVGAELVVIHGLMAWHLTLEVVSSTTEFFRTQIASLGSVARTDGVGSAALGQTSSMTSFTQDIPVAFTFSPRGRRVQPEDASLPLGWLAAGLAWVARYNDAIRPFSPGFVLEFAAPSSAWLPPVPRSQIAVDVISNTANVQLARIGGEGDVVEIEFTSASAVEQSFEYDIVYSSGVYPTVRVRHQATLRPPSYVVANSDGAPVTGTLDFIADVARSFVLRNEDGSAARQIDYTQITVANITNSGVSATVTGDAAAFGLTLGTSASTAQTTELDVLYRNRKVQTLSASVGDSLAMYRAAVPGNWRTVWYYNEDGTHAQTDRVVLYADGTGRRISTTYANGDQEDHTGSWGTDPYYNMQWQLNRQTVDGTTRYRMEMWDERWEVRVGGLVTYPPQSYSAILAGGYYRTETSKD